jgi:hypothetical protein
MHLIMWQTARQGILGQTYSSIVSFHILMVVSMKITAFWDTVPYSPIEVH